MERLQRILAHAGVASRRAAEEMIRAGRVSVDGRVITELGAKADPTRSVIRVDGTRIRRQQPRYILLNKPRGYITTTNDERDRWTVLDLVQVKQRIYPVGRLDRATEGLLLLTNDGEIANRVMHPRFGLSKEYHILTQQRPSDATLQRLRGGVSIDGKLVVPDEIRLLREAREGVWLRVVLHEGLTHVVRRMMESVGIGVERLRRVRIGPLTVSGIPVGAWRDLTPGELASLTEALKLDRPDIGEQPAHRHPRTLHVQRPQPRRRSTSPTAVASAESARHRDVAGRAAVTSHPLPSVSQSPSAAETRQTAGRRRRGEPPAPPPRRKKQETRRDQRQASRSLKPSGKNETGPRRRGTSAAPPGRQQRSANPSPGQQAPRPKPDRRKPKSDDETRSKYDDPSRRRNRRARARQEAKSVSRRDRD